MTGTTNESFVRWPTEGVFDSGEGGIWVLAVVLKDHQTLTSERDPFSQCCEQTLPVLDSSDVLQTHLPDKVYEAIENRNGNWAVVCLGSTSRSLMEGESSETYSGPWSATEADLTDDGRALLTLLEKLYGRKPLLLTYLDT